MTQNLFLVRHGPTHAKGMIGWSDLPADLSDSAALARLNAWLPQAAPVISSDLSRAVKTADAIIGTRTRLPHNENLRELHFGDWEQKTWAEVAQDDPERIRQYYETPGDIAPPNGESWNALSRRVSQSVDTLLQQHQSVIVVCHFGVVLSQLQRTSGKSAYETFAQKIDNLSVTHLSLASGIWSSEAINHCP